MYRNQSTARISGCPHYSVFPSFSVSPSFSSVSSAAAAGCSIKKENEASAAHMCSGAYQSLIVCHLFSFSFPVFWRTFILRFGLFLILFLWLGLCHLFYLLRLRRCLIISKMKQSRSIYSIQLLREETSTREEPAWPLSLFPLRFLSF